MDYSPVPSQLIQLPKVTRVKTDEVIGKGAYGRVIEVYVHGTLCAAKEIHPILVEDVNPEDLEAMKQKFLTECIYTSRIHHPNVVQVLGIHYPTPEAKLPWLVMEMMETSITDFLKKYKKDEVPLHFKLSILVDVAQGLEFLHGQDIIHRDLSSNNVLLTKYFVAKIADLGVAKIMDQNPKKTHTQVPGTLFFMPPEALLVRPRYGKPVDVFSLACIALHVMSHQWPVPMDLLPEDSLMALTEVQRRQDYFQSFTNSSLKQLVECCLHNKPDQRPEISDVCIKLKDIKESGDQHALSGSNIIDLFNFVVLEMIQADVLRSDLKKAYEDKKKMEASLAENMKTMEASLVEKDKKIQDLTETLTRMRDNSSNEQSQDQVITSETASGDRESMSIDEDIFQFDNLKEAHHDTPLDELPITINDGDPLEQPDTPLCHESITLKKKSATLQLPCTENSHFRSTFSAVKFDADDNRTISTQNKNIARSLPDLTLLDDDDGDNADNATSPSISKAAKFLRKSISLVPRPTLKKQQKDKRRTTSTTSPTQPPVSPGTIVKKYNQWQCAGCQCVNKSDRFKCEECKNPCGYSAIAESFCKPCKLKVFIPSYEKLADINCPKCENLLESTRLIS